MPPFKPVLAALLLWFFAASCGCGRDSDGAPDRADNLVRRMSDFYKNRKSFAVRVELDLHVEALGKTQDRTSTTEIVFERPRRFAIRAKETKGTTIVSDGKTMFTSFGGWKTYSKQDAPGAMGRLARDPRFNIGSGSFENVLFLLMAADPYDALMTDDDDTAYSDLGTDDVDGHRARHIALNQRGRDLELWIAEGEQPLLLQSSVEVDAAKLLRGTHSNPFGSVSGLFGSGPMKVASTQHFRGWRLDLVPQPDAFVFTPPKGSKETKGFFGGEEEDEETGSADSPLIGRPAPAIELQQVDGQRFRLADHVGRDVIMLAFWKDRSGKSYGELSFLADVANEYKSSGVKIYAVNEGDPKDIVKEFESRRTREISQLLDPDKKAGDAYAVRELPTLVLIDQKGIVQSIHVGFEGPSIADVWRKELDGVLAGRNLAPAARARLDKWNAAVADMPDRLVRQWSAEGACSGVAYDPFSKSIFALRREGRCDVLGPDGKNRRSFKIDAQGAKLRLARLTEPSRNDLLVLSNLRHVVSAFEASGGAELWRETRGEGLGVADDLWAADLDGDGRDEVIIGCVGFGGLHVLSPDGDLRWKKEDITNVWNVAAGDLYGEKRKQVVSTSAAGKVHVFDADGKPRGILSAPFYAQGIRVARLSKADATDTLLVVGIDFVHGFSMAALDGKGKSKWTARLPAGTARSESLAVCPTRPWAACAAQGGRVIVLDCTNGTLLGANHDGAGTRELAWGTAEDNDAPLLLVADEHALSAYRIEPAAPTKKSSPSGR